MLCQECPKRATCTELCPEAEEYANRDYVRQQEQTVDDLPTPSPFPATKSNIELILEMFFLERKRVTEIAKILDVSHQYVSTVAAKYRTRLAEYLKKVVASAH